MNYYDEIYEPETIEYRVYEDLQKEYAKMEEKFYQEEDRANWLEKFIEEAISAIQENKTLEGAYADIVRIYRSEGYEDYFNKNK